MCGRVCAILFVLLAAAFSMPMNDESASNFESDTAVVESTVREARAAVPESIEDLLQPGVQDAFFHTYGDDKADDGDVQGYSKKSQDKGADGYKHFDSFHKKDGDKYGFEKHAEYGQENKHEADADGKSAKYSENEKEAENEDDGEESKKTYKVVEELNEDDKNRKAVEDYGYYGDSEGYTDGADAENYSEGGDAESEHYEEGDGDESSSYTEGGDDGESEAYTAEEEEDDY